MTTLSHRLLPAGDVAYVLRQALGPHIRGEWSDCLADMRLGKTSISGLVLLPVCRAHDGKAYRPFYRWEDVAEFIRAVSKLRSDAAARVPLQFKTAELDLADGRHWKVRKIKPAARAFMPSLPYTIHPERHRGHRAEIIC